MRAVLLIALAAVTITACKKSSAATAPSTTDTFSIAGTWTGCVAESGTTCANFSMALSDSSLTDSTAKVVGSGDWGETVAIAGKLTDATASLTGTAPGVLQKWTFNGTVAGNTLTGTMTAPEGGSAFSATFTRTP